MSVNAATINQQILTQQFTTQQTAQQAASTEQYAAATTWQPAGMPPGLTGDQPVLFSGQELYLFVDAMAHNPSASITHDQCYALAFFINQFVTACNNAGANANPPNFINSQTQEVYYDLTGNCPPTNPPPTDPNIPRTFPVTIDGTTQPESLASLSELVQQGGSTGAQAANALFYLFNNSNGNGADQWSPTLPLETDLNSWESANAYNVSLLPGGTFPNPQDLTTLEQQWENLNGTNGTLTTTQGLENLAQDINNVNKDLTTMENNGAIGPAFQLLYYALNAPLFEGTSLETLSQNVLTAEIGGTQAQLNTALEQLDLAFQGLNLYILPIIEESLGQLGSIPTTNAGQQPISGN
ncbi:MAG: hypothetical protein JSR93_10275 [Verrucomicrobia bacterium]|nr:hypothetical protein [Verrucomicrobiota bacterium]